LFACGPRGDETGTILANDIPVHQVAYHVAHKDAPIELGSESVPPGVSHPAGGGKVAGLFGMIGPGLRHRDGVDPGHVFMIRNAGSHLYRRKAGEAAEVAVRDKPMLDMVDVVSDKIVSPIVEHQAEPAAAMEGGREIARPGIETEIHFAQVGDPARLSGGLDLPAVAAVEAMDAIVQ